MVMPQMKSMQRWISVTKHLESSPEFISAASQGINHEA